MLKKLFTKKIIYKLLIASLIFSLLSGCAVTKKQTESLERYNRSMYAFNQTVDRYIIKPVATVYDTVLPNPVKKGVTNFFDNVDTVSTIANNVLQLELKEAVSNSGRLVVNTTIGIGGLFDVATPLGLEKRHKEDLGLTFARWGYKDSSYFVLPILGPSTIRDTVALPFNFFFLSAYSFIDDTTLKAALLSLWFIDARAQLLDAEDVKEQALDPYIFEKDAYLQHRNSLIREEDDVVEDDIEAFMEEEDF